MKSLYGSITRSAVIALSYVRMPMMRLRRSAERLERSPELLGEDRRLLPRREVTALFRLVVVNEIRVGSLGPTSRSLILLAGKDAYRGRELHAFHVEETALVFPIETRRGHACVRQPVQGDVVEKIVTRQFARSAGRPAHSRNERGRRLAAAVTVVHQIRSQGDR